MAQDELTCFHRHDLPLLEEAWSHLETALEALQGQCTWQNSVYTVCR